MHVSLMSIPLESTESYFTDNFNKLSYVIAKPTAFSGATN